MLVTTTVAALSWHWYERPLNGLKRYVSYDPRISSLAKRLPQTDAALEV
jgi:hypothetical protein